MDNMCLYKAHTQLPCLSHSTLNHSYTKITIFRMQVSFKQKGIAGKVVTQHSRKVSCCSTDNHSRVRF